MNFLENVDRKKLQTTLIAIISVLTVIALGLFLVIIIASVSDGISDIFGDTELKEYNVTEKDLATGSLILADADHSYTPNEEWLGLVKCAEYMASQPDATGIDPKDYALMNYIPWTAMRLSESAMAEAHRMLTAAKNTVGENPITIDGAYDVIYHSEKLPEFKTALLIYLSDYNSTGEVRTPLSDAYRVWLDQNAASYGFVESFEDGYRFVGIPHAKYMTSKNLSLADYIAYLKENTNCDKALMITVGDTQYAVYYYSCNNAGDTVKVPAEGEYTISGTNEGGVIITFEIK